MTSAQKRKLSLAVNRGARLLDKKKPSWWRRIEPATLEMNYPTACILAQTFGNYYTALHRLALAKTEGDAFVGRADRRAADYGFTTRIKSAVAWSYLAERWLAKVAARKSAARRRR